MNQLILSRGSSSKFYILPFAVFLVLLALYTSLSMSSFANIQINRYAYLTLCVVMSVLYLFHYRSNTLFCYETIFFILYILCVFFSDIVLDNLGVNVGVSKVYFTTFSSEIENKGILVQMLGFFGFMAAASYNNYKNSCENDSVEWTASNTIHTSADLDFASNVISVVVGVYIVYLFFSGVISSWFHYSGNVSNYTNHEVIYITVLSLSLIVIEATRLLELGCSDFWSFIKKTKKICLFEVVVVSTLLLVSGNRNESLLILLPAIVAYSSIIKPISNKQFLFGIVVGITAMVFIGVIRQFGYQTTKDMEIGLFEATRDFGFVDPNTRYLIEYVDSYGPVYFNNAFLYFVSAVPFLGGFIASTFDLTFVTRSLELTTNGMQLSNNMDSGMGTSLIGDLYYTGGIVFMLIFMILFGWFVSSMHNRFVIKKNFNIWLFVLYCFNIANVVYYIRAEWTMPFRYIGFTYLIIILLTTVRTKRY